MKRTIWAGAALAAMACGGNSTSPAPTVAQQVKLAGVVQVPNDTTQVKVVDVTDDSRCPANVQCVWAGDAAVSFLVGGTTALTLHTNASVGATSAVVGRKTLRLVSLAPLPEAGKTIAKGDYVVTIRFD